MAAPPEKVWERFKPQLAEAQALDKKEQSLVFLASPLKVGRFWLAPLTLKKLLYLEAFESPFLTGGTEPTKADVLRLLWIMSPKFSPSILRGKIFFKLHGPFLNWHFYLMEAGEVMGQFSEMISAGSADEKGGDQSNSMWAAQMIDGFAAQYHWPLDAILEMPLIQVSILGRAMGMRLGGQKNAPTFNRHADKVRADVLKEISERN